MIVHRTRYDLEDRRGQRRGNSEGLLKDCYIDGLTIRIKVRNNISINDECRHQGRWLEKGVQVPGSSDIAWISLSLGLAASPILFN